MKEKTRKIFIMIVMAALIVSLMAASFAALTYGRYSGGRRDENSAYEDILDFVGATAFEVTSPDAFINAINNGYSYIKIADDAEEPFVINNNVADVYTNLVLDVNGHVVVRNSRNPLLDVRRSISVVLVYDSSTDADGGFYNPVGSSLQTSGGTLTVGAGVYESGPNEEYQTKSYQTGQQVTLFNRGEDRTGSYPKTGTPASDLPILTGKNAGTQEDPVSVYDFYFESAPGGNVNSLIEPDTYLIYTKENNCYEKGGQLLVNCTKTGTEISGTSFRVESDVASCDFYYYYPVEGTPGTTSQPQTYAVVYGYNDVKGLAEDSTDDTTAVDLREKGLAWPYAAIRSVEDPETQEGGVTHARGGAFTTNFGTDNTYGILSVGGEMTVGTESATAPPTFAATGEGTCIGMSAQTGDTLTIASGTFSSEVGDTILMRGGEMTVTGGTFTKTGSHPVPTGNPTATDYAASRTALIHMLGGDLTVNGTVTGESDSTTYSVNMTAGSTDAPLTNVFGIYSTETTDETTGKAVEGTVTISGCKITVNGTYSAGVLSSAGTVNVGGKAAGKADTDITVANSIESNRLTSSAVSSEGGEVNLNSTVNISSDSLGITARGEVNVMSGTTKVNTPNATGVYVNNGTLTVKNNATLTVDSAISNASYSWVTPPGTSEPTNAPNIYNGVYVQNGSLNSTGTLNVTHTGVQNDQDQTVNGETLTGKNAYRLFEIKSYAVRVEGDANTTVTIASGNITNSVGGGVLVNGGTVHLGGYVDENGTAHTSQKPVTVQTTGKDVYYTLNGQYINSGIYDAMNGANGADDGDIQSGGNWRYLLPKTGGPAVKVTNGDLSVYDGSYQALQGDGIVINGGTAEIRDGQFLGQDSYYIKNNYRTESWWPWEETEFAGASVVTSNIEEPQAGPAASYSFKVYGGTANVYGGTFGGLEDGSYINSSGAFVMGTANSMGSANIYGGSFVVSSGKTGGQAGFSVYEYGNVVVNPGKGGEQQNLGGDVTMTGLAAGLVIEGNTSNPASVQISDGTFSSTRDNGNSDGIWYSNSNATLRISGGTFTGAARSGLYFAVDPSNSVEIKGGTFYAGQNGSPISHYLDQVVPSEYGIISGSNTWGGSCTIGQKESRS